MDLAKAFRQGTSQEVIAQIGFYYGIRGYTHRWTSTWLSLRSKQIVLDGQASDLVPVLPGVPKGSVLGPVFFLGIY